MRGVQHQRRTVTMNDFYKLIVTHGLGVGNEKPERLLQVCINNDYFVSNVGFLQHSTSEENYTDRLLLEEYIQIKFTLL